MAETVCPTPQICEICGICGFNFGIWAKTAMVTGSAVRGLLAGYELEKEQETLDARNSAHFDCRR